MTVKTDILEAMAYWQKSVNKPYENHGSRDSGIELLRIIAMFFIICHHLVFNTGVLAYLFDADWRGGIVLVLGGWGKVAVNVFVLITGYFMCMRKQKFSKFLLLYFQVVFYNFVITSIFILSGRASFEWVWILRVFFPFSNMQDFIPGFLVLLLLIPACNALLAVLEKRRLEFLLVVVLFVLSVMPLVPGYELEFNYVEWFVVVYCVGGYLRKYPVRWLENQLLCTCVGFVSIVVSCVAIEYLRTFRLVIDCNKVTALLMAVEMFFFFRNLKVKHSVVINTIASATFGVLLIHANSNLMRSWLYKDAFNVRSWFGSPFFFGRVCAAAIIIYFICVLLELGRKRFLVRPLLSLVSAENKTRDAGNEKV